MNISRSKRFFLFTVLLSLSACFMFADSTTTGGDASQTVNTGTNQPPAGVMAGGAIDKSSDTVLKALIAEEKGKFKQFIYIDNKTNLSVPYNLYIPDGYVATKSYPLVLFIADSSVVGQETTAPLTQGYGALVWTTKEQQSKHASFVLVPEYPKVIIDDHGSYTTTDYVELTARLLEFVQSKYSIDKTRMYGTGQSMGCMTIMYLSATHPELFAGQVFVSGQWDVSILAPLSKQNFFYIAAAGDDKASQGQKDLLPILQAKGAKISSAVWNAKWDDAKYTGAVSSLISEKSTINFVTFEKGSVLPAGVAIGTSEHMYSFDWAYKIKGIQEWLFDQKK